MSASFQTTGTPNSANHGRLNTTAKALYGQGDKTVQAVPQQDGVHDEYDDVCIVINNPVCLLFQGMYHFVPLFSYF